MTHAAAIFAVVVLAVADLLLFRRVFVARWTGRILGKGRLFSKDEQPGQFWMSWSATVFIAIGVLIFLIKVMWGLREH